MSTRPYNYASRSKARAPHRKSKFGCPTCKIRHVRCDERRPVCLNCEKTGRTCDYDTVATRAIEYLNTQNLSVTVPGNRQERRQFAFFTANTAPNLSGYFERGFWDKFILQVSFEIPALRHAVLALSSLHESYSSDIRAQKTWKDDDLHSKFAVKQYTQALGHLRKDLEDGRQNQLVTLMACVLFICFDSLRGQYESAVVHLRSGMQITQNLLTLKTLSSKDVQFHRETLMPLLKRLWLQALSFDNKTPEAVDTWDDWIFNTTSGLDTFTTLEDARNGLHINMDCILHFFYITGHPTHHTKKKAETFRSDFRAGGQTFPTNLPESAIPQQKILARNLFYWKENFNIFMEKTLSVLSSTEIRAATLLEIHYMVIDMITKRMEKQVSQQVQEEVFYNFKPDFDKLLGLCRGLVLAEQAESQSPGPLKYSTLTGRNPTFPGAIFSIDLGVIGPLYVIALRSKNTALRWEAVSLLRMCKRREGMWDSVLAADACTLVINADMAREANLITSSPSSPTSPVEVENHVIHLPIRPISEPSPNSETSPVSYADWEIMRAEENMNMDMLEMAELAEFGSINPSDQMLSRIGES